MKKFLIIVCLMMSCSSSSGEDGVKHCDRCSSNAEVLGNIVKYYKDTVTGVCYAAAYGGFNGSIFTHVPCTPEVENIAYRFKSVK